MDNNAKSCVSILVAKPGNFWHNFRRGFLPNDCHKELVHENEYTCSFEEARRLAKQMRDDAVAAYQRKYNQKPQFDEEKIFWEASINAREYHTLDDLRKAGKIIEKKTGYRMVYGAIHRDEGHLNDAGQFVKNTHFQILFISLDENGNSMHRITRGKRQLMRDIQTEVAKILGMERGIDKRISGREHLTPRQYKQAIKIAEPIKQELKIAKADLADAKAKIKTLEEALKSANLEARNALKEQGGKREDYAALEQENRLLKNELAALKKMPADVNVDDEMAKIVERIQKIKNSKRVVAEAETEFANLKNGFGILDRDKVYAFVSEAVALGYAAHEQIRSYVPVLNDVERYKAEAAQAANLKDNKIAKAFFGGIASKPDVDVDALKKENTVLLQTFDKLQKQNERLQGLLKTAEHSLNAKDAQIAELQKNQEGLKLANDSFFLGQAALLSELVRSGQIYIEPKGRYLVESLDDISSGKTAISNFAGIKSGLLSYSPVSSSPKNDLEM